jgi:hypothetical protein
MDGINDSYACLRDAMVGSISRNMGVRATLTDAKAGADPCRSVGKVKSTIMEDKDNHLSC